MILYPDKAVIIGRNFRRGYMVDIGTEGFAFLQDPGGRYHKRTTKGPVIIGSDVFINSFCSIHRGLDGPTVIGNNCILDCYAHISHDVRLEASVQVGARVTLLGHVMVGHHSRIFAGAVVNPKVRIGSNCIVGACSYVRHDVPDNAVVYGNPAAAPRKPVKYPRSFF